MRLFKNFVCPVDVYFACVCARMCVCVCVHVNSGDGSRSQAMGPEGQEIRGNPSKQPILFHAICLLKYGGERTLGESAFESDLKYD